MAAMLMSNELGDYADDQYPIDALLTLTGVLAELDSHGLEKKISHALNIVSDRVSIMDADEEYVHFVVDSMEGAIGEGARAMKAEELANIMNVFIKTGGALEWLGVEAKCTVAEMEEEVLIDEDEALHIWREMPEDCRTSHLAEVLSPDGVATLPTHEDGSSAPEGFVSPTYSQLKRDPGLLHFDNVSRVDASQLEAVTWAEPIVITGVVGAALEHERLALARLVARFGDAEVRTGNRNTLAHNGFNHSRPMALREAMEPGGSGGDPECNRMVFSPVQELPDLFQQDLEPLVGAFPCEYESQGGERASKKFTLCIGTEGFGIGFHRHNAAMFMLLVGRKKWYLGPQATEKETPTHPDFYTKKSSHKCIQQPGEVLYVPDQWYHEIFNLEYTAGIQALPF
mmetsp:Transcript_20598/g.34730  ORF Transcript_20598/g.34730 Transcript_20598/m.34730 type:complete len:399 (+) Transcript_20598:118-1314(+)